MLTTVAKPRCFIDQSPIMFAPETHLQARLASSIRTSHARVVRRYHGTTHGSFPPSPARSDRRRSKNWLKPTLMKKIAAPTFVVQLIMTPSACLNVMKGAENGADQFAAGRSFPRDDADRQRDGRGEVDGGDAAGRKPDAARLPGAAQDGSVRETRQRPGADGLRNGALYGGRA